MTRCDGEVAVVLAVDEYPRLTTPRKDLTELLHGPPYFDDVVSAMYEIDAEYKKDFLREGETDVGGGVGVVRRAPTSRPWVENTDNGDGAGFL